MQYIYQIKEQIQSKYLNDINTLKNKLKINPAWH